MKFFEKLYSFTSKNNIRGHLILTIAISPFVIYDILCYSTWDYGPFKDTVFTVILKIMLGVLIGFLILHFIVFPALKGIFEIPVRFRRKMNADKTIDWFILREKRNPSCYRAKYIE